jgi:hypothetical protein
METAAAEAAGACVARDAATQRLREAEEEGERVARLIPQYRALLVKAKVRELWWRLWWKTPTLVREGYGKSCLRIVEWC